jgi:hypothetical protein
MKAGLLKQEHTLNLWRNRRDSTGNCIAFRQSKRSEEELKA